MTRTRDKKHPLYRFFNNIFVEDFLSTIGLDKETRHFKVVNDSYKKTVRDTSVLKD